MQRPLSARAGAVALVLVTACANAAVSGCALNDAPPPSWANTRATGTLVGHVGTAQLEQPCLASLIDYAEDPWFGTASWQLKCAVSDDSEVRLFVRLDRATLDHAQVFSTDSSAVHVRAVQHRGSARLFDGSGGFIRVDTAAHWRRMETTLVDDNGAPMLRGTLWLPPAQTECPTTTVDPEELRAAIDAEQEACGAAAAAHCRLQCPGSDAHCLDDAIAACLGTPCELRSLDAIAASAALYACRATSPGCGEDGADGSCGAPNPT